MTACNQPMSSEVCFIICATMFLGQISLYDVLVCSLVQYHNHLFKNLTESITFVAFKIYSIRANTILVICIFDF